MPKPTRMRRPLLQREGWKDARQSTNIDDQRVPSGIAPLGSAGYVGYYPSALGGNIIPDLEQPLKLPVDRTAVDPRRAKVDRVLAKMAAEGAEIKRRNR